MPPHLPLLLTGDPSGSGVCSFQVPAVSSVPMAILGTPLGNVAQRGLVSPVSATTMWTPAPPGTVTA